MRLATVFSGIGSIEQACKRLSIPTDIVFACDNGDVDIDFLEGNDLEQFKRLEKLRARKKLNLKEDILLLEKLNEKYQKKVNSIRAKVQKMKTWDEKKSFVDRLYEEQSNKKNFVRQTYLSNYEIDEKKFYLDIRFLDAREFLGQIDLLVGGSPCQSFSSVGARGGFSDTRGTLFYEFARIIKESKPRVFIYENVRGLLTHDNGKTWEIMRNVFEKDLGYKIAEPQVLNASDFGIPQTRRRLFVIGIRNDIKCQPFKYPLPIKLKYTMQDFLQDNCAEGGVINDKKTGMLNLIKRKGVVDSKFILTPAVQKYVLAGGTGTFKTSTKTDLPIARTLMKMMTQHHRAGVDNYITVQKSPLILRQLSDREALRLMGYPDDFKIKVSSTQILRQAGNSIVVDVMMAVLKEVLKTNAIRKELV